MITPEAYIKFLLSNKGFDVSGKKEDLLKVFMTHPANIQAAKTILENQELLMENYKIKNRIHDILQQHVTIPNAIANKAYEARFDYETLGWNDLPFAELGNLEAHGLKFDPETQMISGTPLQAGDFKLRFKFRVPGENDAEAFNEKTINFIVNPDPKSLWKNLPGDTSDPYWKEDNASTQSALGDKTIVVASRRGRSHANAGSFRDDAFAFKHLKECGWNIIAMADGAGSAKFSRKGSEIACDSVISYFETHLKGQLQTDLEKSLNDHADNSVQADVYPSEVTGKAAIFAHAQLKAFADESGMELRDLHTTLIFTLFKKLGKHHAFLSFSVGDCPIAVLNKDMTEVSLLNTLDVGEFSGGTRFITMPEIFTSETFISRSSYKAIDDFSYLFLMTDGIYDPKFSVEANLAKPEHWQSFVADLKGDNPDGCKVELSKDNKAMATQLSSWMDFWSPGNHDDRTLAIIF